MSNSAEGAGSRAPAISVSFLGDSIAAGTGATGPSATPAEVLRRLLTERYGPEPGFRVDVLAVPGATSYGLPAQVDEAVAAPPAVAVVIVGANDLIQLVPPPEAIAQLAEAVTRLRAAGAEVVAVSAPDLSVVPSVPPEYRAMLAEVSGEFAAAQEQAVRDAGGRPASLRTQLGAMFTEDPTMFADDAFHPSDAGYVALAEALLPIVAEALEAADATNGAAA